MLARSYEALGDHSEAIQCYQKVLQLERDDSVKVRVTRAASYFALFIVVHRRSELYDEALEMLEQARSFLVEQQFIVHACRALIFDVRGDNERTRAEANEAIALVDVKDSGLRNREKLGLVNQDDFVGLIQELQSLVTT